MTIKEEAWNLLDKIAEGFMISHLTHKANWVQLEYDDSSSSSGVIHWWRDEHELADRLIWLIPQGSTTNVAAYVLFQITRANEKSLTTLIRSEV